MGDNQTGEGFVSGVAITKIRLLNGEKAMVRFPTLLLILFFFFLKRQGGGQKKKSGKMVF